jgi:hypothetical protein
MAKVLKDSTVKLVHSLLTNSKKAREDDKFIVCCFWKKECSVLGITDVSGLLNAYHQGKLTNHDSVTRARRKLQELYPELRGENYEQRQNELEPEIREEINQFKKV